MRDKVLPARVVGGSSGTKFSLLASNAPKSAFFGVLGEFCTGSTREGCEQGGFCTGPSNQVCRAWSGLVLWAGCFEGCWLLLVVLCPLARVLVG